MKKFLVKGTNKEGNNFAIIVNAENIEYAKQVNIADMIASVDEVIESPVRIGDCFKAKDKLGNVSEWEVTGVTNRGYYVLSALNETLDKCIGSYEKMKKDNPYYDSGKDDFVQIVVELEWFNQRKITLM